MSKLRVFNYNLFLLSLAAYVTLVTLAIPILRDLPDDRSRWLAAALFIAFAILASPYRWLERHPLLVRPHLAAQAAIIAGLFLLNPQVNDDVHVLFFVLSAEAMLFLPTPVATAWIINFFVLTLVGVAAVNGWHEVVDLLPVAGGHTLFGSIGALLRRENAARRQSQQLLEELQAAHQQLREYTVQARQLAAAEERNRLAREVHDALGHRLTVAIVQLEGAQRLIPTEPERAAPMVGSMRQQLKEALGELRQTVAALRAPATANGKPALEPLETAVVHLTQTFHDATGLAVHLNLPPELPDLPVAHRQALYRAAQESLTNVQRHAGAAQAWLDVQLDDRAITLRVTDDGRGFAIEGSDGCFGLQGLRERATQLGGELHLGTRPGGGAEVRFCLPLTERESREAEEAS